MGLTVFTRSGTAGCAPKTAKDEEPAVLLVLTCGTVAMSHEIHPMEALRLGHALIADAESTMKHPAWVKLRSSEEY